MQLDDLLYRYFGTRLPGAAPNLVVAFDGAGDRAAACTVMDLVAKADERLEP